MINHYKDYGREKLKKVEDKMIYNINEYENLRSKIKGRRVIKGKSQYIEYQEPVIVKLKLDNTTEYLSSLEDQLLIDEDIA